MGKIIRDIWILTESGLTLFSRVNNINLSPQVFGGLISALNSFAETLSEGGISNFELSSFRLTILKDRKFLFVVNSYNGVKPKKVRNELKKISKKFFKVYPEEVITNWGKNVKVFSNFEEYITESFE